MSFIQTHDFLSHLLPPYEGGRLGWGWTSWIFPPHLNPPPPWGEEVIFLTQLGFKKKTKPDKVRFFNIAQGSLEECRYYLILARDLDYGDTSELTGQIEEVSKLLEAYLSSILDSIS